MNIKIAIIDYGFGNIKSVINALNHCGADPQVIQEPSKLSNYGGAILPGVGAFAPAAEFLKKKGFDEAVFSYVEQGKTLYGTCLGFQLLFTESFENGHFLGLNLIKGKVKRFIPQTQASGKKLKIPHIGWNNVSFSKTEGAKKMFEGISDNESFYFVHSYHVVLEDEKYAAGWTDYGSKFCSAIAFDNIWGSQFHPEKSGVCGLKAMSNFIKEAS
jgi:glutamine amidotransferase